MPRRPILVSLLAVLSLADILLLGIALLTILGPADILSLPWLLLGVPSAACGYGLWRGRSWARRLTIALNIVGAGTTLFYLIPHYSYESSAYFVWDLVSPVGWPMILTGSFIPSVFFAVMVVWYMARASVGDFFAVQNDGS